MKKLILVAACLVLSNFIFAQRLTVEAPNESTVEKEIVVNGGKLSQSATTVVCGTAKKKCFTIYTGGLEPSHRTSSPANYHKVVIYNNDNETNTYKFKTLTELEPEVENQKVFKFDQLILVDE